MNSPVVWFLALAHILIGMLPVLEWSTPWIMHEKQRSMWPIITTLCSATFSLLFWIKTILKTVPFTLQFSLSLAGENLSLKPLFLISNKHPLSSTNESCLIIVVPYVFYHPDLLSNQAYNWELNLIYKWFIAK